jgi:hypothetical protein
MKANIPTYEHVVNAKLARLRSSARFCLHADGSYQLKSTSVGEPVIFSFQAGDRFVPYATPYLFYSRLAVEALSKCFHGADCWWVFKMFRKRDSVLCRSGWRLCDLHYSCSVPGAPPLIEPLSLCITDEVKESDILDDLFVLVDLLTPGVEYSIGGSEAVFDVWLYSFNFRNAKWGTKP